MFSEMVVALFVIQDSIWGHTVRAKHRRTITEGRLLYYRYKRWVIDVKIGVEHFTITANHRNLDIRIVVKSRTKSTNANR